jgi:prephenate dehydrogenase
MEPEVHDRCAAVISHLPHLMAAALVHLAHDRSAQYPEMLELIAGSFRDMTRVAGSPPVLWRDICLTNIEAIMESTAGFEEALSKGLQALESGDSAALEDWFCSAKQVRDVLFQSKRENEKIG